MNVINAIFADFTKNAPGPGEDVTRFRELIEESTAEGRQPDEAVDYVTYMVGRAAGMFLFAQFPLGAVPASHTQRILVATKAWLAEAGLGDDIPRLLMIYGEGLAAEYQAMVSAADDTGGRA